MSTILFANNIHQGTASQIPAVKLSITRANKQGLKWTLVLIQLQQGARVSPHHTVLKVVAAYHMCLV